MKLRKIALAALIFCALLAPSFAQNTDCACYPISFVAHTSVEPGGEQEFHSSLVNCFTWNVKYRFTTVLTRGTEFVDVVSVDVVSVQPESGIFRVVTFNVPMEPGNYRITGTVANAQGSFLATSYGDFTVPE